MLSASVSATPTSPRRARSAASFLDSIGINTHIHYYDTAYGNFSLIKQRLQELGVRHIRDGGSDPTWIQRINELAGVGIKSTIVVDPNIGVGPNHSYSNAPPGYSITQLVKEKLPGAVEAVETLNEFDFFHYGYTQNGQLLNGDTWVSYLRDFTRDTYQAIKGDPATQNIAVIGPSFVYGDSSEKIGPLSQWVDYGNLHPYNYPSNPGDGNLQRDMQTRSKPFGDRPLVATEGGYHTGGPNSERPVSEAVQGKYIPRMYLEKFNQGVHRTFSYELIDQWQNADNKEANFGLLRNDGSAKPAFTAQANLMKLLNDGSQPFSTGLLNYSLSGNTQNVRQTLLQKRNGEFYLVLWLEVPSTDQPQSQTVSLHLDKPINHIATYLPNQSMNPTAHFYAKKDINLSVPDYPLVVRLQPARRQ